MDSLLDFPDNQILHLERNFRSYKVFTTETRGKFKVIYGLNDKDSIIDVSYVNERDLKQLYVDACINGYELKTNMIFKKNLYGIAKELAEEREMKLKEEAKDELPKLDRVEILYDC